MCARLENSLRGRNTRFSWRTDVIPTGLSLGVIHVVWMIHPHSKGPQRRVNGGEDKHSDSATGTRIPIHRDSRSVPGAARIRWQLPDALVETDARHSEVKEFSRNLRSGKL